MNQWRLEAGKGEVSTSEQFNLEYECMLDALFVQRPLGFHLLI